MNIFDNDFPEVTEAYRGSLEDWLELFERFAFPIGKETDTSKEMKRYLKYNPEATYEDWLDRVIKSVRDELWYEEKINLSIRELYLVVNKVARLDKKLRATYNKFNILTEDREIEDPKDSEIVQDTATSLSGVEFALIIEKAKAFGLDQTLSEDDKLFWNGVKTLVRSKKLRYNMSRIPNWVDRLVDYFMKPLYMEDLLLTKLDNRQSDYTSWYVDHTNIKLEITGIKPGDTSRKYLYPDNYADNEIQPDFTITGNISDSTKTIPFKLKMECKSVQHNNSDLHEAPLVIIYALDSNYKTGTGQFYIRFTEHALAENCILKNFLDGYNSVNLPQIYFKPDFKLGSDLGFFNQEDWKNVEDFEALKKNLYAINKNLKDSDKELTKDINKCTDALKQVAVSPEIGLAADSIKTCTNRAAPEKAANTLIKAARTVATSLVSQSTTTQNSKKL